MIVDDEDTDPNDAVDIICAALEALQKIPPAQRAAMGALIGLYLVELSKQTLTDHGHEDYVVDEILINAQRKAEQLLSSLGLDQIRELNQGRRDPLGSLPDPQGLEESGLPGRDFAGGTPSLGPR